MSEMSYDDDTMKCIENAATVFCFMTLLFVTYAPRQRRQPAAMPMPVRCALFCLRLRLMI